jgi:cation:H+ antiporter
LEYFLFILGFIILIYGADLLVNGASAIGAKLHIPDTVIGLTIVALGTSLPEVVINVFATARGDTSLAISNVLGSNLMNILVIVGIASVITPLGISKSTTFRDIPVNLFSVILLAFLVNDTFFGMGNRDQLGWIEGIVFLLAIIIYILVALKKTKIEQEPDPRSVDNPAMKSLLLLLAGIAMMVVGGRWIVNGTIMVSELLGFSSSEVGLVVVATATSLPELATSIVAAIRKNPGIAVGNAVGSCIFNVFLVLGLSSLITPLPFDQTSIYDLLMVILASVLIFVFVFTGKGRQIERWEGILMLLIYFAYMVYRFKFM